MLQNEVNIKLLSPEGELLFEHTDHNDFADDILVCHKQILTSFYAKGANPYCFLQQDGAKWTGYSWNRRDPYIPYPIQLNRTQDATADAIYQPHANAVWDGSRWKLFYQWSQLPFDMQLKAVGLMDWENNGLIEGVDSGLNPTLITPMTLVILPQAITVRGRIGGTQTPDILQVSYYLSVAGVS
jgi:hypothetical protein